MNVSFNPTVYQRPCLGNCRLPLVKKKSISGTDHFLLSAERQYVTLCIHISVIIFNLKLKLAGVGNKLSVFINNIF